MSPRRLVRAWNEFFFAPQPPTPVALFRVLYGALVTIDLILMRQDWLVWFGPRGTVSIRTMHLMEPGTRINLFTLMPDSDLWVEAFFWIFLAFSILLTLGLLTRTSSVVVFLCLTSIQQRNLYIVNSGDALLRVLGFYLIFAPAGAALSIDRLIRIRKGADRAEVRPCSPWAQRMMQFQVALTYLATFATKLKGAAWINGTALYYVYHLQQFQRFPLPAWVTAFPMVRLETWLTLVIEFSLGVLIWFRRFRYPVLLVGLLLHLSIEYSMNIPLFEWIMISTYVLFVYPADLARFWEWAQRGSLSGRRPQAGRPAT